MSSSNNPIPSSSTSTLPNPSLQTKTKAQTPSSKLAKNKRLPATMITPSGGVEPSKKKGGSSTLSRKQKARVDKGKERAVELSGRLAEKVKGREDRKAKRLRAKNAWE